MSCLGSSIVTMAQQALGARRARGLQGPWKAAAFVLFMCVSLCSLPTVVRGALPATANISALPLSQRFLYTCPGVVVTYTVNPSVERIIPISTNLATQPYKFEASGTLTNAGYEEVSDWELFIGFQHHEVLAEAPELIIGEGKVPGALVENGTSIRGVASPDLLTSINTAEDLDLIQVKYNLTGTEFGVGPAEIPLPNNLTLLNEGYKCDLPEMESNVTMVVCCKENRTRDVTKFWSRSKGDITIYYDVFGTFEDNYNAQVTLEMLDPIGRIDHWNLTWTWRYDEFITQMKGAQTLEQELDQCLTGPIFEAYPDMDFTNVMSCQRTPSIVDLNSDQAFNPTNPLGCCRNGTLMPAAIDPKATKSVFTLNVQKGKKQDTRDNYDPPYNWRIGDLNKIASADEYKCGIPRIVEPSTFDGPGLHENSAAKTWEITCNRTILQAKAPRKCCVSFSGFYNSSVIPCPTCACGGCGPLAKGPKKCNPNIDPMLLPTYSLLLPPSNRSRLADDLARIEKWPVPTPRPCPDNCGVTINWHIYSDYDKGFSTRVTLFNWDAEAVPKWFMAIELNKTVMPAYLDTYSFNGSLITDVDPVSKVNKTLIFLQGKEGYNNFLLGLDKGLVPGKVQSLMSFDKRKTTGIDVVGGDGFPKSVWFNGDECALPDIFPMNGARRLLSVSSLSTALLSLIITFVVGFV